MRLARLIAAGLAVGVVIGFVIALLRPRPNDPYVGHPDISDPAAAPVVGPADDVLDIRSHRPVTG
jgi:hypothetical protein